jgi:hypothetical protein
VEIIVLQINPPRDTTFLDGVDPVRRPSRPVALDTPAADGTVPVCNPK